MKEVRLRVLAGESRTQKRRVPTRRRAVKNSAERTSINASRDRQLAAPRASQTTVAEFLPRSPNLALPYRWRGMAPGQLVTDKWTSYRKSGVCPQNGVDRCEQLGASDAGRV